jgi:DNA topoisomerase IA
LKSENEVMKFFSSLNNAEYQIEDVEVKPWKKAQSAPFTTLSLWPQRTERPCMSDERKWKECHC